MEEEEMRGEEIWREANYQIIQRTKDPAGGSARGRWEEKGKKE